VAKFGRRSDLPCRDFIAAPGRAPPSRHSLDAPNIYDALSGDRPSTAPASRTPWIRHRVKQNWLKELQREANTLGSKSAALELTNVWVEMKVLVEQMREQVQNIE